MDIFKSIIDFLQRLLDWYYIVQEWQQAIHLRKGRLLNLNKAGIYFKIPFIDTVYLQTVRLRTLECPMQTLTTNNLHSITIKMMLQYRIVDMYKLYNTLHHPETTMQGIIMSSVAEKITSQSIGETLIQDLEKFALERLNPKQYGIGDVEIKVVTMAVVKTFRLIQDGSYSCENLNMEPSSSFKGE